MTKKNLAALMLAGAMMTVGSGAMADAVNTSTGSVVSNNDIAKVSVGYTASADVKITLEWNSINDFVYKWNPTVKSWDTQTAAQTLTFKAKNDGIVAQKVTIADSTTPTLDWLTVTGGAKTSENVEPAVNAETQATEVAIFTLTGNSVNGISGMSVDGDAKDLSFTVTIADVTPQA